MSFLPSFLEFFFATTIVSLIACLLTLQCMHFRIKDWTKALITATLFFYVVITLSLILLGSMQLLFPIYVYSLQGITLLIVGVCTLPRLLREWKYVNIAPEQKPIDWFRIFALFSPFLFLAFTRFFNATLQVPVEYDNLAYHLPFAVSWLQSHGIWDAYYSAFAGPLGYYPSNFELMDLWAMLPFHSDLFINLLNLPIFIILPFLLFKVARNFGIKEEPALLVVAFFLMMPVTLRQLGTPLVDLYFYVMFLIGIYFLQEYRRFKILGDVMLAGLALGLFVGTKYLGIVYVLPLMIGFFIYVSISFGKKIGAALTTNTLFFISTFLTGSFWYIRNWIDTGNPLFPTDVALFGKKIFEGYTGITENLINTSLMSNIPIGEPFQYFLERFFVMVGGQMYFFIVAFLLMIPLIMWKIGESIRFPHIRKRTLLRVLGYSLITGAIVVYLFGYWFSPYSFKDLIPNVRYAMMFLLFCCFMLGIVMSEYTLLQPVFYLASFGSILYNFVYLIIFPPLSIRTNERLMLDFTQLGDFPIEATLFAALLLLCGVSIIVIKSMMKQWKYSVVFGLLLINIGFLSYIFFAKTTELRELKRADLYFTWYNKDQEWLHILDIAEWFNKNAPTASIAYTGFNFHYPLFGRDLERTVEYINVNTCAQCTYKDFKDKSHSIRSDANFDAWDKNLKAKNKEYVVIKNQGENMFEYGWMNERPSQFQQVFMRGDVYVFKVL